MSTTEGNPIPQGKYLPASRSGNLVFSAGMTPRNKGVLILDIDIFATVCLTLRVCAFKISANYILQGE